MAKKNPAAVQLGRRGGKATAKKLTVEQRKDAARKAAKARWDKQKGKLSSDTRDLEQGKRDQSVQGRGKGQKRKSKEGFRP